MKKILLIAVAWLCVYCTVIAQDRLVSGKVTSAEDGAGAPGVSVLVKGTSIGTSTDNDGNFSINVPAGSTTLIFSFIGFRTTEVEVGNRTSVNVALEEDVTQLSEVVVVGYGTQVKQDVTGNIAKVSGADIQHSPVTSFEQALQGRAAGVLITSQNGKLGQGINVRVRGSSSISAGNEPLYVIDGMIVTTDNLSSNAAATNPLADLNFNDIESIEVLKDASSAAIYGSRAANGVVLITTKRGKVGKTAFTVNYQYGSSKPSNHREFLNAAQYVELMRESAYNNDLADGFDPINNPGDYDGSWLQYMEEGLDFLAGDTDWRNLETDTNWENEAFQKANIANFDFTASGGNEKTTFFFGGGVSDQGGILLGNHFKRVSGRVNLDHRASEKLNFGLNVAISKTLNDRLSADNAFATPLQLVALAPITPVRDKQGILFDDAINPASYYYPATVEYANSTFLTTTFRNLVGMNATYNITPNLRLIGEYGFDLLTQNEDRYQNSQTQAGRDIDGVGQSRWVQVFNYTARGMVAWDKVSNDHTLGIISGVEFQSKSSTNTNAVAQGYPLDELSKLASAAEPTTASSALEEETFSSVFARANYKFKNRYLFSLSARVDGSSKFGPNVRYGFFPAASAGWVMSEEGFLSGIGALSFLKLRGSYGMLGNSSIPNYSYLAQYGGIAYGPVSGLSPNQIPNPDLSWETTTQMDIGIDFAFFNDRLSGELDYYNKQTKDLLLNTPVPGTSGFQTQFKNIGDLENVGIEAVLNYQLVQSNSLTVTIGGNFANNKNKILKLDGDQTRIGPAGSRYLNAVMIGEPIGVFYGREFAGADPDNGDALWYVNGTTEGETTNSFNTANSIVLGSPTPDIVYGFNMSATYKGIELSVLFQGVSGNKVFNGGGGFMTANGRYEDNSTLDQLERWQNPGDITMVPQARLYANNGAQSSSRYLYDGSYTRLKNITLGYTFPSSLAQKVAMSSLRVYVTGQNLITFTDYPGWDPEVNTDYNATNVSLGNDFYSAPQPKNLIVGVKLGF